MPQITTSRGLRGRRAGESHPRARLTDHEIELMRTMHEELGMGYRRLARIFECGRSYVQKVCRYTRRRG